MNDYLVAVKFRNLVYQEPQVVIREYRASVLPNFTVGSHFRIKGMEGMFKIIQRILNLKEDSHVITSCEIVFLPENCEWNQ